MPDTINDITVSATVYSDVNTLSSIAAGTALVIENKSNVEVRLQISASQPAANSTDGEILYGGGTVNSIKLVTAGENKVWAKAVKGSVSAKLNIQDNT